MLKPREYQKYAPKKTCCLFFRLGSDRGCKCVCRFDMYAKQCAIIRSIEFYYTSYV